MYCIITVITFILLLLAKVCECSSITYFFIIFMSLILVFTNKYRLLKGYLSIIILCILSINMISITNKISILGSIAREVVGRKYGYELSHVLEKDNNTIIEENNNRYNEKWEPKDNYFLEEIKMDNFKMEYLHNDETKDKIILNIHGGGYIYGIDNAYRDLSYHYSEITEGLPVLMPNYREASISPYPAAFLDCIEAYKWILSKGYKGENIILVGDSAGGSLALSLTQYLIDNNMEVPNCIVTWSAWGNLACDSNSYRENCDKDTIFGSIIQNNFNCLKFPYVQYNNVYDKYLSPINCAYKGFPDMLMQVGSFEVVCDDTNIIAKKAKENGVDVQKTSYYGMFHVFQFAYDMMPESKKAWDEIEDFLQKHI